jgi:hypothetical protein
VGSERFAPISFNTSAPIAGRLLKSQRWWPRPIPSWCAFARSAGTVRFISFEILTMGVLAFECAFRTLTSS